MSDARSLLGRVIVFAIVAGAVILAVVVVQADRAAPADGRRGRDGRHYRRRAAGERHDHRAARDGQPAREATASSCSSSTRARTSSRVQRARAEVAALDGEIGVTERRIEGQRFAVAAAKAGVQRMEAQLKNADRHPQPARAAAAPGVRDSGKIDQARTAKLTAAAGLDEARQKMDQAEKDVGDLEALLRQARRGARGARQGGAGPRASATSAPSSTRSSSICTPLSARSWRPAPCRCFRSSIRARGTSWRTIARRSSPTSRPEWRRRSTCSPLRLPLPRHGAGNRVGGESRGPADRPRRAADRAGAQLGAHRAAIPRAHPHREPRAGATSSASARRRWPSSAAGPPTRATAPTPASR